MSGEWTGAGANRMWRRGHPREGTEDKAVLAVLAAFRQAHGWTPGMVWNPYQGVYEAGVSGQ